MRFVRAPMRGGEDQRRRVVAVRRGVVLAEADGVEAERVGPRHLVERRGVELARRRPEGGRAHVVADHELHGGKTVREEAFPRKEPRRPTPVVTERSGRAARYSLSSARLRHSQRIPAARGG